MGTIKKYTALLLFLFIFINQSQGQNQTAQGSGFRGTVEEQFDHLINNSFPYDNFKNIRGNLPQFRKNTLDSLHALQSEIKEQNTISLSQKATIDSLQISITNMEEALSQRDSISLLGLSIEKGTYNLVVWLIILVLTVLLLFFIQRYKSNLQIAKESKETAEEIREEYNQHRKKAMEREQKLKRDLQDELNKSAR